MWNFHPKRKVQAFLSENLEMLGYNRVYGLDEETGFSTGEKGRTIKKSESPSACTRIWPSQCHLPPVCPPSTKWVAASMKQNLSESQV